MSEYLAVQTVYREEDLLHQAICNVVAKHGILAELHPRARSSTSLATPAICVPRPPSSSSAAAT